ncbi:MAG: hypothetical protein IIC79_05630 [Chloroflexi bacterium]|nr:hypothetical protein [Chloroflexota bacterium]
MQARPATAEDYARTPSMPESAGGGRAEAPSPQTLHAPGTLREFIVRALEENPQIKAAEETARAKAERIAQVINNFTSAN